MFKKLKAIAKAVKAEIGFYRELLQHKQTPIIAKFLLWLALAYLVLPFDIVPDFIPVIGQLDDVILIGLLIFFALKITPKSIIEEIKLKTHVK